MTMNGNTKVQSIKLDTHISDIVSSFPNEDICLPANKVFQLLINYPCKSRFFTIVSGKKGLKSFGLIRKIGEAYKEIYKDPKGNGVWGHDIGDLFLEGIEIDFENYLIKLKVGS